MYRNAYDRRKSSDRQKVSERPTPFERDSRHRIPRSEGQAEFLEAMGLLAVMAVLAVALGLMVGLPLAMMLNDVCASLKC